MTDISTTDPQAVLFGMIAAGSSGFAVGLTTGWILFT